ncbi:uncharacterized protein LOC102802806, partial [Saccoglossus kowalevskii]|uniref:Uncharacterized protein LOC102802806 n=1 Tax=Saccoglossus kowalevskii TaxID=10224 RepID=A0ABM0MUH2_SACKO
MLQTEVQAGRVAGPFQTPPFNNLRISPLGLVPKKQPNKFRLIYHLSCPSGSSINNGISAELATVQYANIDDAVKIIKDLGPGCFLAKSDIKSAFRIIPVAPHDHCLLGFRWDDHFFFDRCLPMGCSTSCHIFERFSSALEWILLKVVGVEATIHILDDFLFLARTRERCFSELQAFLDLCADLGVPIAQEKTMGPNTSMVFAGIKLDTVQGECRLPQDKLLCCRSLIDTFLVRKKVMLNEIQSLVGTLNFACIVVVPGRAFLRRLIDLTKGIKKPNFYIRLTKEVKADLLVWKQFLDSYDG